MSYTRHSKGSWEIAHHLKSNEIQVRVYEGEDPRMICSIPAFDKQPAEANAILISAAPELLEALIEANRFIKVLQPKMPECDYRSAMTAGIQKMEAAIAKATQPTKQPV